MKKYKYVVIDKDGDVCDCDASSGFDADTKEAAYAFAKYHAGTGYDCAVYQLIATAGRPTEIKFEEEV